MNGYRISGTLSITGPDGETITLGMLSNDADSRLADCDAVMEPITWPTGWSGTFTVSAADTGAADRFFNEMQAEWVREQLRVAMRDALPHLCISDRMHCRQIDTFDISRAIGRVMQSPAINHEPRRKVAQWKRERSPLRYC